MEFIPNPESKAVLGADGIMKWKYKHNTPEKYLLPSFSVYIFFAFYLKKYNKFFMQIDQIIVVLYCMESHFLTIGCVFGYE